MSFPFEGVQMRDLTILTVSTDFDLSVAIEAIPNMPSSREGQTRAVGAR